MKLKQFSFQRFLHPPHQSALLLYVDTYKFENLKKNSDEQAALMPICLLGAANIWTRFQRSQNQRRAVGAVYCSFL